MLHWLLHSTPGIILRLILGLLIFIALAFFDIKKNGQNATRWKEYAFLFTSVLAALLYGIINDQITVTISPEYFLWGKEIYKTIGEQWPPDMFALRLQSMKIAVEATWSVGLVLGVALLIANNPFKNIPRLRTRQLLGYIPIIFIITATCGILGGLLGYHGYLTHTADDFQLITQENLWRPRRFICTYGVHLGDYIGGVVGTIIATMLVVKRRRKTSPRPPSL